MLETIANRSPVLTSWRYGLGRATALMTEAVGPGTVEWEQWKDYGAWLGRTLARTARDRTEPFAYVIDRHGASVTVSATSRIGTAGIPVARLVDEDGELGAILAFRQRSLAAWEARWLVDPAESVRVLAGARSRLVSLAAADRSAELQVDPQRMLPLGQLAASSGGMTLPMARLGSERLTVRAGGDPVAVVPLWPWLLLTCLLLYLGELLLRRRDSYSSR